MVRAPLLWASTLLALAACASRGAPADEADLRPRDGGEALRILLEGNERFVSGRSRHDHESQQRRSALVAGQHPCAVVLGCADSRVIPELVFDLGLGDLFVIRVAGNVVADDEAGSIEYGVHHLELPLVLVLGHEGCGAVTAALAAEEVDEPELLRLLERIRPAVEGIDPALPRAERVHRGVEENVRRSVRRLRELPEIADHVARGTTRIVGAVYELETGRVRLLAD